MSPSPPLIPALKSTLPSFDVFFRNSPVAMKVLNPENEIIFANPAFQRLLERDQESLRHTVEVDLIHPVDLFHFRERFERIVARETEFSEVEARHRHADGHWIPTLISHIWLSNEQTSDDYLLEIVVDLTRYKNFEQPSAYSHSKQLLGQMARGVAHDFNNLLTVMMTKLELIDANADTDRQALLDDTRDVLERMKKLSNNLARFGQRQPDDAQQLDVNEAIRGMEKYFEYISPKSVAYEFELDESLPLVDASEAQLEQILLNLVVNACDAIDADQQSGTVTLCTRTQTVDGQKQPSADLEEGMYVVVSVRDNGVGMDRQTKEQIFEPYFTTKDDAGTGVGLSTVYAIVQQGRGYLDVDSVPGDGTRIDIYLPVTLSDRKYIARD